MQFIKIFVRNKIAKSPENTIVCGNSDYKIIFDFDKEWNEYTNKVARFEYNGLYQDVFFSGNECPVPVFQNVTLVKVGVYAGELHTTTPALITATKSILCGTGLPDEPPQPVPEWITNILNTRAERFYIDENGHLIVEKVDETTEDLGEVKGLTEQEVLTLINTAIEPIQSDIDAINDLIPNQATEQNKLADKDFVNSSIATNTAYYISNNGQPFNSVAELEAYSGTLTNNDYAFIVEKDEQGRITAYKRYKYNSSTEQWAYEYTLNNSSFTAVQWAAINSGITREYVNKIPELQSGKLDKVTTTALHNRAYVVKGDGTQIVIGVTPEKNPSSIVIRDANGSAKFGNPQDINDVTNKNYVDTGLNNKVDKVSGKGLSTNDYTDEDKAKLDGMSANQVRITFEDGTVKTYRILSSEVVESD